MKVYTSYFGNAKKLKDANIEILCVAIGKPKFLQCPQLYNLCPTRYMLSEACSHEKYLKLYDEILNKQNPYEVIKQLERIGNGKDVALCCYEKPGDFCHRHILAKWLSENTGMIIEEYGVSKEPKYTQCSLF